jgi:uncharacterized membrane protein YkoI
MEQASTAMQRKWRARVGMTVPALLIAMGLQPMAMAKPSAGNAAHPLQHEIPEPSARPLADLSEDRIIAIAEKRYGAKVMKIDKGMHNGKRVYLVKLMDKDLRVRTVKLDAETGGEL